MLVSYAEILFQFVNSGLSRPKRSTGRIPSQDCPTSGHSSRWKIKQKMPQRNVQSKDCRKKQVLDQKWKHVSMNEFHWRYTHHTLMQIY